MDSLQLYSNIRRKGSFLCIGLDTNPLSIPPFLRERENPLFEFNKGIIDATHQFAVAYKPNLAFYEAEGAQGWRELEMTIEYIRERDPSLFIIADAKRGDIGNTAEKYASAFFERMDCDAVTLAPYMGSDSIIPFLKYENRWAVILALTSNPSAEEFEMELCKDGTPFYRRVIEKSMKLGGVDDIMFVVGATRPDKLAEIREYCPDNFFLVPGVGAQGGSLEEVVKHGMNSRCGLLVNLSRDIIYSWKNSKEDVTGEEYKKAASAAAEAIVSKMRSFL